MLTPTAPASTTSNIGKQIIVGINSLIMFLFSYLLCHVVYQGATVLAALSNSIRATLFPGHIEFKIFDSQWSKTAVITTYAAGPFLCLAMGFIFITLFNYYKQKRGLKKVFFLWAYIHSLNFFFGGLLAGTVVSGGFWYAVSWTVLSDALVWFIAFIFMLVLIGIGIFSAPAFLFSCDSMTLMKFANRQKMLFTTVFFPWMAGFLVLVLIKFPDFRLFEGMHLLTLALVLIPVYFLNQHNLFSKTVNEPRKTKIAWTALLILAGAVVVFRMGLAGGLFIG